MKQKPVSGGKKRRIILIIVIALLMLAAAVCVIRFTVKKSPVKEQASSGCPEAALKEAGANLVYPIDPVKLKEAAQTISATKGYESNADCTYVTTFYQLQYGSTSEANVEFAKLKKAFDPTKGYGSSISKYALSPDALRERIDGAIARTKASIDDPQSRAFINVPEDAQ